jgi:hypothetical protein
MAGRAARTAPILANRRLRVSGHARCRDAVGFLYEFMTEHAGVRAGPRQPLPNSLIKKVKKKLARTLLRYPRPRVDGGDGTDEEARDGKKIRWGMTGSESEKRDR